MWTRWYVIIADILSRCRSGVRNAVLPIATFGLGTQKVEEMLRHLMPKARILRMDADTTTGKNGHEGILSAFREGKADILIGTQMIVKGHDFPNVTLVAALAADMSMFEQGADVSAFAAGKRKSRPR